MRIFLIMFAVIFFSSPLWAADSGAPAATPATGKVINDDDIAAPAGSTSLSDLRDQQIQSDDENAEARENSANADADTDPDACTARDVSAAMRMPENIRDDGPVGQGTEGRTKIIRGSGYIIAGGDGEKPANKSVLCKAAYDKMTNSCYKDMPCSGCEDALKQFSTACGYVRRDENMDALGGTGAAIGKGGGRTLDGRRNVPINKLPQM